MSAVKEKRGGKLAILFWMSVFLVLPATVDAASRSPVGFSAGDYAGDFVIEKAENRVWYIDPKTSRRYQVGTSLEELKVIAQPMSWVAISSIPDDNDNVTIPLKKRKVISGLVYDPNAPDLIWHIRKRAYKRHALRTDQDLAEYIKNAIQVTPASLVEYPIAIAKANLDYAIGPVDPTATTTGKYIYISLKEQRLRAYENGRLVKTFLVSTGSYRFPTPPGNYSVLEKDPVVNYQWSYGKENPDNYDLGNVPYNLMFRPHMYIHYAYWHNNFGRRMSHGCINVSLPNIKWVYRWADEGIPVKVR